MLALKDTKIELTQKVHEVEKKYELLTVQHKEANDDLAKARSHVQAEALQVEALQKKLAEEHKVNAQLVFFNRSLKTQVCELEDVKEDLGRQLAAAKMELERHRHKRQAAEREKSN
ncbi:hypothetical protein BC828DRAFT_377288 [Blastocladiella britannica]|nr:hypothetical protein BC828DRAFT_377288 [Blastocladiella britannica]